MVCHEANRAYCQSIGDDTQPSWSKAPEWQKDSSKNGVKFHLKNPKAKPEDSHISWMEEKIKDGWKYGKVKNPAKKQHPCMVPYNKLPVSQRRKDALFIAVVHALTN